VYKISAHIFFKPFLLFMYKERFQKYIKILEKKFCELCIVLCIFYWFYVSKDSEIIFNVLITQCLQKMRNDIALNWERNVWYTYVVS